MAIPSGQVRERSSGRVTAPGDPCATIAARSESEGSMPRGLSTLSVHAGEPRPAAGPLDAPLVLSSTFCFADADVAAAAFRGENDAYIYGRWATPSVEALEAKIAALEAPDEAPSSGRSSPGGGWAAVATGSGMAAVTGTLLTLLSAGDH